MIDEKRLIKHLIECQEKDGDEKEKNFLEDMIWLISSQPQVGGWIPVTERLPDKAGNYLVTRQGYTWVANWFNNTWWGIEKKYRWADVEAWQPLPEPFKEEKDE